MPTRREKGREKEMIKRRKTGEQNLFCFFTFVFLDLFPTLPAIL